MLTFILKEGHGQREINWNSNLYLLLTTMLEKSLMCEKWELFENIFAWSVSFYVMLSIHTKWGVHYKMIYESTGKIFKLTFLFLFEKEIKLY